MLSVFALGKQTSHWAWWVLDWPRNFLWSYGDFVKSNCSPQCFSGFFGLSQTGRPKTPGQICWTQDHEIPHCWSVENFKNSSRRRPGTEQWQFLQESLTLLIIVAVIPHFFWTPSSLTSFNVERRYKTPKQPADQLNFFRIPVFSQEDSNMHWNREKSVLLHTI